MRSPLLPLLSAAVAALMTCYATAADAPIRVRAPVVRAAQDVGTNRVIVKFRSATSSRASASTAAAGPRAVPSRAEVAPQVDSLAQRSGIALSLRRSITPEMHSVALGSWLRGAQLDAAVQRIASDAAVEFAVPDRLKYRAAVPNDPYYSSTNSSGIWQWYLAKPDSTFVAAIDAQDAWDLTTGDASIVVADIDTGILKDHPDLAGKLLPGYDFVEGDGLTGGAPFAIANDGNGWDADPADPGDWVSSADYNGWNALWAQTNPGQANPGNPFTPCAPGVGSNPATPDPVPSSWHGTAVTSVIAAASNNGIGMTGIGWNTKVLPVRVLGKCAGYDSDIIAGMYWAAGLTIPSADTPTTGSSLTTGNTAPGANPNPAQIVNLSLGGQATSCSTAYAQAISDLRAKNVVIVAAAGNDSGAVAEPALCAGVIGVGGLRHAGTKVGFANVGSQLTISAPAGNCVTNSGCQYPIVTATNLGTTAPVAFSTTGDYAGDLGTSFSTPMVSGVVALMLSVNKSLTPDQVSAILKATARTFPAATATVPACDPNNAATLTGECACTTSTCGAGMLDAYAAVSMAQTGKVPTGTSGGGTTGTGTTGTGTTTSSSGGGGAFDGTVLALLALGALGRRRRPLNAADAVKTLSSAPAILED